MSNQETLYFTKVLLNFLFVVLLYFDLSERVNHSGMILMTEGLTNLLKERSVYFLARYMASCRGYE